MRVSLINPIRNFSIGRDTLFFSKYNNNVNYRFINNLIKLRKYSIATAPPRRNLPKSRPSEKEKEKSLVSQAVNVATRTITFSLSSLVVCFGIVLAGGTFYYFYTDIISPSSSNALYLKAFDMARENFSVQNAVGVPMKAFGEAGDRWTRESLVASSRQLDKEGNEHVYLRFYISGPNDEAVANVQLAKKKDTSEYYYVYFVIDPKQSQRIFLVQPKEATHAHKKKFLGVDWTSAY